MARKRSEGGERCHLIWPIKDGDISGDANPLGDISSDLGTRVHFFPTAPVHDLSAEDLISRQPDYLTALKAAIFILHQCNPVYQETVFIRETTKKKEVLWEGPVSIFDVTGHKTAKTCYAWVHADAGGNTKVYAVLGSRVVNSPKKAVQAAIFGNSLPVHKSDNALELLRKQVQVSKKLVQSAQIGRQDLSASIAAAEMICDTIRQNLK